MNSWAQGEAARIGYIFFREGEGAGPLAKNIGRMRPQIRTQLGLEDGDAVFSAPVYQKPLPSLRPARNRIGESWG